VNGEEGEEGVCCWQKSALCLNPHTNGRNENESLTVTNNRLNLRSPSLHYFALDLVRKAHHRVYLSLLSFMLIQRLKYTSIMAISRKVAEFATS